VVNQELGLAGDRHGDHDALLLPARQLVRVRIDARPGLGNADLGEQFHHAVAKLPAAQGQVQLQHLGDLVADREHRVQRGHRLLEHHRNVLAAHAAQVLDRGRQQVLPAEQHPAVPADDGIVGQQPHDRHRRHALARARLAHQRDGGVLGDVEAHALDRLGHLGLAEAEADAQVAHGNEVAHLKEAVR